MITLFSQMIQMTRFNQTLHNLTNSAHKEFSIADIFISSTKKIANFAATIVLNLTVKLVAHTEFQLLPT